jgi:hypothetical protein
MTKQGILSELKLISKAIEDNATTGWIDNLEHKFKCITLETVNSLSKDECDESQMLQYNGWYELLKLLILSLETSKKFDPKCLITKDVVKEDEEEVIIALGLSERQVLLVVKEWYTNGMCLEIYQNSGGQDLEECLEIELY